MSGGGGQAPPVPDYSGIVTASREMANKFADIWADQLAWAKEQYGENKAFTDRIKGGLATIFDPNIENAKRDRARWETVYQPVEDAMVRDAMTVDSPENMERMRGRAVSNVSLQFDRADEEAKRALEGYGIDPSATRFRALDVGVRTARAAAAAGAANQSDIEMENVGRGMRAGVVNIGRQYPGQIAGEQSTAISAGTGAVGSQNQTYSAAAPALGNPTPWAGLNLQAQGLQQSALNNQFQNAYQNYQTNQNSSSGIGGALGMLGGLAASYFTGGATLPAVMAGGAIGNQMRFAEGGRVPTGQARAPMRGADMQGRIPMSMSPSAGAVTDDIQAHVPGRGAIRINAGEFVLPRRTTNFYGTKFLHGLIQKADKAMQGGQGALPV